MEEVTNFNSESENIKPSGARYLAVKILSRFERSDAYLDKLLEYEQSNADLIPQDVALLTELVNGVTRWRGKLDWVLTGFYKGDYQKCLNIVKNSMRVGLYQMMFLTRVPIHAAINETVEIVKFIQGEKTAGIVNGVLRNIARNMENVRYPERSEDLTYYLATMYSHPKWIVKRWLDRFGEQMTEELLAENNVRPNVPARVNTLKADPDSFYAYLSHNNVPFVVSPYLKESFYIKTPKKGIDSTDSFKKGMITVQDTSASMAVKLANPQPGWKVIDLCSAPGGKTFFMAELMKDQGEILAVEKYSSKLRFISEGAERLGLTSIHPVMNDASTITVDEPVDLVFADVPCSGLGTLSKKPDIKWKREAEDIPGLVTLQRSILANAAHLVKPGGVLVYSTCTIENEENIENINWFLENYPNFELDPAENHIHPDLCKDGFMQTFPCIHKIDGAFAARLIRKQ
jgi:16S rRNA (cytosine967-C5)-methyltransferase